MAGALLNVRMETSQLEMQKAVLENKLNATDAEFAMEMAETNDPQSFPFNKEQVEKYYQLKAKEAALIKYKEQLTEQYEEQLRQVQGESGDSNVAGTPSPPSVTPPSGGAARQSRNPIKRALGIPSSRSQQVPVADSTVELQSKSVEGNWELVDKSPSPIYEQGPSDATETQKE